MIAIACTLAAVLVLETSTPTTSSDCPTADNLCKARRSERRAATAPTPDQRAQYLHSAHRSYLFLFDQTGDMRDLCSSRRTFDASVAVKGQSAAQRKSASEGELVARERLHGPRCGHLARQRQLKKSEPPLVAKAAAARPAGDPPRETDLGTEAPPLLASRNTTTERPPDVSPLTATTRPHVDDGFMPIPRRVSPKPATRGPRPGRGLVIAGAVTLGAGVVLSAAAGAMGHQAVETRREYFELHNATGGLVTPDQKNHTDTLYRDYHDMWPQTLAMALAGGTTIVIAAVLAGVGGCRMARAASRTAIMPVPGGLAFHARF